VGDRFGSEDDIRRESEFLFRCYSDPSSDELPRSASCVDERGGVGMRLELAAAIVRRYGQN
jgi:hypothetical protein